MKHGKLLLGLALLGAAAYYWRAELGLAGVFGRVGLGTEPPSNPPTLPPQSPTKGDELAGAEEEESYGDERVPAVWDGGLDEEFERDVGSGRV